MLLDLKFGHGEWNLYKGIKLHGGIINSLKGSPYIISEKRPVRKFLAWTTIRPNVSDHELLKRLATDSDALVCVHHDVS